MTPEAPVVVAPAPGPPAVWPAFVAFIAVFVGNVAVSVPFLVVGGVIISREGGGLSALTNVAALMERLPRLMILAMVGSVLATVSVAVLAFFIARQPLGPAVLAPSRLRPPLAATVALYLAIIGYGAISGWVAVALGGFEGSALDAFERLALGAGPGWFALLLVAASLGPGFGEELLFRGFIQPRLVARWGAPFGVLATATMFGIMHMDVAQGAFAIGMGAMVGWFTHRSGTLWPAMIAHAVNNATSFALTRLAGRTTGIPPPGEIAPYVVALGIGAALLAWLSRRVATSTSQVERPQVGEAAG